MKKSIRKIVFFILLMPLIINPFFIERFISEDNSISKETFMEILIYDIFLLFIGIVLITCYNSLINNKKIKSYVINTVLTISTFFICILLAEVALRIYYMKDNKLKVNYEPYSIGSHAIIGSNQLYYYSINSLGFRDNEFILEYNNDVINLLVLGDSFTFGIGVNQNETFSDLIEEKLNRISNKTKFQVLNTGKGGVGTDFEYDVYKRITSININPQIVLLFYVDNDPVETYYSSYSSKKLNSFFPNTRNLLSRLYVLEYYFKTSTMERDLSRVIGAINSPSKTSKYWNASFHFLKKLNNELKSQKIPFIIIHIPSKYHFYKDYLKYFDNYFYLKELNKDVLNLEYSSKILKEFSHKEGIIYYYLKPEFLKQKEPLSFYHNIDGHWNKSGHKFIAEIVVNYLIKNKLIRSY